MANNFRKFRQLSLTCDNSITSNADLRRKTFKKQFSEDQDRSKIKISLSPKMRDRPPLPVKIAWAEPQDEGVIVKKCPEVKRPPAASAKLTRHSSLEKDSILYSKQELADRLREALKEREQQKPNLNIFLAHNSIGSKDEDDSEYQDDVKTPKFPPPKLIPSLLENNRKNVFQIRKSKSIQEPSPPSSRAVVVIPIVEKPDAGKISPPSSSRQSTSPIPPKPINNVIIRPATAAAKREQFQKKTSLAFNSISKEDKPQRPPLVRSSSAPTTKPKFVATKRKIRSSARRKDPKTLSDDEYDENKENPKNRKELNGYVPGSDIVTMVSLVSPSASDTEEAPSEIIEKSKVKVVAKKDEKEAAQPHKNLSLRKTVKSVSFQQSSIHAIRSFSASFPARRSSMASTLGVVPKSALSQKTQEKRSTPDEDERGPKRRLLRSASTDATASCSKIENKGRPADAVEPAATQEIAVDIKSKPPAAEQPINLEEDPKHSQSDEEGENGENDAQLKFGSSKEQQCWEMYCKMTDKGIKVSYDTILRGMLTPTEYRLRRKDTPPETRHQPLLEETI